MKCPKCGAELDKDRMYCEKCGNEIQIVPDFEPEIENSITQTLITVAKDAALSDTEGAEEESKTVGKKGRTGKKRLLFYGAAFFLILLLISAFFIFTEYKNHSASMQMEYARNEYQKKNYVEAVSYYEKAVSIDENEMTARLELAECYSKIGEEKKALNEYLTVLQYDEKNETAYAKLIALYEKNGEYNSINNLLMNCTEEKIQYAYQQYMAPEVEFNYEEGTYDQVIPLKLIAPSNGKIYYTLDESNPGKGSLIYTAPIFLKKGSYTVSAIYINDYGIESKISKKHFEIESQSPNSPLVEPASGGYMVPMLITVEVPKDCNVYYTTDGSAPDGNSSIYGEPIPMEVGESRYKFVAISKEGVPGDMVEMNYSLSVETKITKQDAINQVRYRLVEINHLADAEGNLVNMDGKNIYVFDSMRYLEGRTLYFIYEYYQEGNQSRNMTGNIYAVDGNEGRVFKAVKDDNGNYSITPI